MRQLKAMLLDDDRGTGLHNQLYEVFTAITSTEHSELPLVELSVYRLEGNIPTKLISEVKPDLIFLAHRIDESGNSSIQSVVAAARGIPVVLIADNMPPERVLYLVRLGIADFIAPPLKSMDIIPRLCRLISTPRFEATPSHNYKQALSLQQIIGESPTFVQEINKIQQIARFDVSVMISGQTGTGKELVARAIHYMSARSAKPFIPVNCGAIPLALMENELFGHQRGAFTDAVTSERGVVQEANGGTLFFDEIDGLSLASQVKLLRFLQEKEFKPLGSAKLVRSDVRVIAATSIDLQRAIVMGQFRRDLYYRLNVMAVNLPQLRERRTDIPLLARHFLAKYHKQFGKQATSFSTEAQRTLLSYDWPGNVRELENVVIRALILSDGPIIEKSAIRLLEGNCPSYPESFREAKERLIGQFEKSYLQELLANFQGNVSHAAKAAKKDRRSFWQLVRKHRINVQDFRPKPLRVSHVPHR